MTKDFQWQLSPDGMRQRRSFVKMVANGQQVPETEARYMIRKEYDSQRVPAIRRSVSDKWRDDNDRITREKRIQEGKKMEQRIKREYQRPIPPRPERPIQPEPARDILRVKDLENIIRTQERKIRDLEERIRRLEQ